MAANYSVVAGTVPSDQQALALQQNITASFATNPAFKAMGDHQKQELYETFIIYGSFSVAGYEQGKSANDEGQQAMFQAFARSSLEAFLGVPATSLSFDETGLVIH